MNSLDAVNSVEIIHKNTMRREPGETDLRTAVTDEEIYLRKINTP